MIYTLTLNPALDYVMHPLTLDMGITNRSSHEEVYIGGNGINVATILNELNVPNIALGFEGGFTGEYLLHELQAQGIVCSFVHLEKGFTRINVKLNGIVMSMVNGMGPKIPESKLDDLFVRLDRIEPGDTLVLTGSVPNTLPDDIYDIIMRRLSGRGIRFVVDAPGTLLLQALPSKPFLIKPNNHEVGRLFNVKPETPEEVLPWARLLHERGAANVIVSCGGYGSALIDEDGNEHIVPVPPCRLIDARGAGDSMVAGFLAKVDEGNTYEEALRFASACGSATAASKGLADRAHIEKLRVLLDKVIEEQEAEAAKEAKAAKKPSLKAKSEGAKKSGSSKSAKGKASKPAK